MAKLNRERAVLEKRHRKAARKEARKQAAAAAADEPAFEPTASAGMLAERSDAAARST